MTTPTPPAAERERPECPAMASLCEWSVSRYGGSNRVELLLRSDDEARAWAVFLSTRDVEDASPADAPTPATEAGL